MQKRILIIEDDILILELERDYFLAAGFDVDTASDGEEGVRTFSENSGEYQAVVLDIMMPRMDGFQVLDEIRKTSSIPVLFVTAKKEDGDKIKGLSSGCNDYIVKPFNPNELVARVKANIDSWHRIVSSVHRNEEKISAGDIEIWPKAQRVIRNGEEIFLPAKEFDLLLYLASHHDQVLSKEEIFSDVWGYDVAGCIATVTVHINRLREKLEDNPNSPRHIKTVWGAGYRFCNE